MIKSLTIENHLGESINIELENPEKSGFFISKIEGLGPPKAIINTSDMATNDGSLFNSSRVGQRNIVLTLGFLSKPTIEYVRQLTYKYFPIKKQIRFQIETDNRICETYGNVESNEPIFFSSMTGTVISIICPDPYFYSTGEDGVTVSTFYAQDPLFEFEFSNESLTENLIEFGNIISVPEQTIYYEGDADTGIRMYLHALGAVENITIHNTQTRKSMRIDTDKLASLTGFGFGSGDTIIISTIKGAKSIYLLREGNYINILNCLDRNSEWFQLSKGDNVFAYEVESGFTNLEFRIENQTLYEGV